MQQVFYVIRDGDVYWSDADGWTDHLEEATKFSQFELDHATPPLPGNAPEWVRVTTHVEEG